MWLNEECCLVRLKSYSKIVKHYLKNVLSYLLRIVSVICKCLKIGYHNELIKFSCVLKFNSFSERTYIMAKMKWSCWSVACKNNIIAHVIYLLKNYNLLASFIAFITAIALLHDSWYSFSGTESATTPPPAWI